MLFRRKKKLRRLEDQQLLLQIDKHKERLDSEKQLILNSIDLSDDVLYRSKITESLYSFLLREARERHVKKNKL